MKGSTRKQILAIVTAVLLAAVAILPGIGAFTANAAGTNYETGRVDTGHETTLFTKNMVMEDTVTTIPELQFTFTASSGEAQDATATTLAVLAGVTPDKIKFYAEGQTIPDEGTGTVVYATQPKSSAAPTSGGDYVVITEDQPDSDHYIATKKMYLNFSQVVFTEPGVYRYIITETGTNSGVVNDPVNKRTLDVYVEDASTPTAKKLTISGYVLYKDVVTAGPSNNPTTVVPTVDDTVKLEDGTTSKSTNTKEVAGATKSVGFQNFYPAANLTFGKEVKGNQGSRDKYFKFTVSLTGLTPNSVLIVDVSKADSSLIAKDVNAATTCIPTGGATNEATITADASGEATADYYLQDGQYITIVGLSEGVGYSVTEEKEDYTSSEGILQTDSSFDENNDGTCEALTDSATGTISKESGVLKSVHTGYTNTRDGVIPTGVILSVAPWVVAGIVLIGGIVFFAIRSRRKLEEE